MQFPIASVVRVGRDHRRSRFGQHAEASRRHRQRPRCAGLMLVITFALEDDQREFSGIRGPLADLAAWTGGDSLVVRDSLTAAVATRQILSELHHQYVVAFEPGKATGWHPVLLRARKPGLFVRARSGYMVKVRKDERCGDNRANRRDVCCIVGDRLRTSGSSESVSEVNPTRNAQQ